MFTPENVEKAFRKLFSLYSKEKIKALKRDHPVQIEEISIDLLAWKYAKDACDVCEYRFSDKTNKRGIFKGDSLWSQNAAYITELQESCQKTEKMHIYRGVELWLLDDMQFAAVHCTRILTIEDEKVADICECRTFMSYVDKSVQLPVDGDTLVNSLDDTCLFAKMEKDEALRCGEG